MAKSAIVASIGRVLYDEIAVLKCKGVREWLTRGR
jgi:hypothetical protein